MRVEGDLVVEDEDPRHKAGDDAEGVRKRGCHPGRHPGRREATIRERRPSKALSSRGRFSRARDPEPLTLQNETQALFTLS
jgi:hypothetical protein